MQDVRIQNEETKFKEAIKEISFIVRKHHFDYLQLKYVFKEIRKKCEIKPNKGNKGVKQHLSQEDAMRLINHAYMQKGTLGLMIKTLLFTLSRVNEFVNIKVSDFDKFGKKIYLSTTKGDKPRYTPVFDFLMPELIIYIGDRKEGYLFESNRHSKYSTRRIQQIVKQLAKEVGITHNVHPHELRRSTATWLREKGMPIEDIQMLLGHNDKKTTEIYTSGAVRQLGDMGSKLLIGVN